MLKEIITERMSQRFVNCSEPLRKKIKIIIIITT